MQRLLWFSSEQAPPGAVLDAYADGEIAWLTGSTEAQGLDLSGWDVAVVSCDDAAEAQAVADVLSSRAPELPTVAWLGAGPRAAWPGTPGVIVRAREDGAESLCAFLRQIVAVDSEPSPREEAFVARSPAMRDVAALVGRAAHSRATVLIQGETGTGKELVARRIHERSARAERAFVAANCAAFPDTLLESELFGHVRGAFTSADRDKTGLFEAAHQGTLFLDEIGETSGPFQAKLLRVLQESEVRAVGSTRTRSIDVRIVAATHRDLAHEVAGGHFREDLYYRLAVFPIRVPALRERPEDVLPLAEAFLARHGVRDGRPGCRLSKAAATLLLAHAWPGNARELENEIQRALALCEPGEEIEPERLSERLRGQRGILAVQAGVRPGDTLFAKLERIEAFLIRDALEEHAGHRTATARHLGVTREGLYKKMKRLGIE